MSPDEVHKKRAALEAKVREIEAVYTKNGVIGCYGAHKYFLVSEQELATLVDCIPETKDGLYQTTFRPLPKGYDENSRT